MLTNAESLPPHTGAVATIPKSHIIECFFNMVVVSKHLGSASKTRALPAVGSGRRKEEGEKKTSQVKFKDVFLLDVRLQCHKPRETFSCSTFFMVSLWVSSLPFSLHLGSRVTYCCTGCKPQPAGHCGVASSITFPPPPTETFSWLSLYGSYSGESLRESPTWTALLKLFFHHCSQIIPGLPPLQLTARSNRLQTSNPLTYRHVFIVPLKEFYCKLPSQANLVWCML